MKAAVKLLRFLLLVITAVSLVYAWRVFSQAREEAGITAAQSYAHSAETKVSALPQPKTIYEIPEAVTAEPAESSEPEPQETLRPVERNPVTGTVFTRKYADEVSTISADNISAKDCYVALTHIRSDTLAVSFFVRAGENVLLPYLTVLSASPFQAERHGSARICCLETQHTRALKIRSALFRGGIRFPW